jgi:hypothetical protein
MKVHFMKRHRSYGQGEPTLLAKIFAVHAQAARRCDNPLRAATLLRVDLAERPQRSHGRAMPQEPLVGEQRSAT